MKRIQVHASGVDVEKTEEWFAALEEVLEEADILQLLCKHLQF